ncbi:MAG: AAA family ATPase [Ardenticatenaceae bacterium]
MNKSTNAQTAALVFAMLTAVIPIIISYITILPPQLQNDYPWLPSTILATVTLAFMALSTLQSREPQDNDQSDQPMTEQRPYSPYIIGPPIKDPANFFGRQPEVKRFFENLNGPQPQPLYVLGFRRAGKTSFLRHLSHPDVVRKNVRDAATTLVIYIDLQAGIKTEADFYLELAEGINRSLPKGKRLTLSLEPTRDRFMAWLDSPQLKGYRLIFLLDEFEALTDEAGFDAYFFKTLRSMVSDRLLWVTSSYRDFYRLSRINGPSENTSCFFNIFHPTPIILGGLTAIEADDLIQKPATSVGVRFSSEEIVIMKRLAGELPFFLQIVAAAWFEAKQEGQDNFRKIKAQVKQKFLSGMRNHFYWYWLHFEEDERELFSLLATEKSTDLSAYREQHGNAVLNDLLNYGLIIREGQTYRIAGEVFAEWIREGVEMESGADNESA